MNRERDLMSDVGFILMPLLLIMGLVSVAAASTLLSAHLDLRTTAYLKTATQAFYIAEAGLNHGWDELQNGDGVNDFSTVAAAAGATTLFRNTSFGGGSYTVTAEVVAGSNPTRVKLISTGCLPAGDPCPPGRSKAVMEAHFGGGTLFPCAVCGRDGVTLSLSSQTDSFDSSQLPYTILTAGSEGDVLSNGDILLSGLATRVRGSTIAGGSVLKLGGATVTGAAVSGAAVRHYFPPRPCGPPYSSGAGITGGVYNPSTGQLLGAGAIPIVLASGTYCFSSIDLSGSASALTVTGPVRIFLTAHSRLTGGTVENATLVAENLKIFSSLASTKEGLEIAGAPLAYMAVYAPNAKIVTRGGDFHGSVVGGFVETAARTKFHYDKHLRYNQDGGITMVTWREVF